MKEDLDEAENAKADAIIKTIGASIKKNKEELEAAAEKIRKAANAGIKKQMSVRIAQTRFPSEILYPEFSRSHPVRQGPPNGRTTVFA